jgi:hypothetical protein
MWAAVASMNGKTPAGGAVPEAAGLPLVEGFNEPADKTLATCDGGKGLFLIKYKIIYSLTCGDLRVKTLLKFLRPVYKPGI